jgi:hypothetical protein
LPIQSRPHHRGDYRDRIASARQAAEALFAPKPKPSEASAAAPPPPTKQAIPTSPPDPGEQAEVPASSAPLPSIPKAQMARIRTWLRYGMTISQIAEICGVPAGDIEHLLRCA